MDPKYLPLNFASMWLITPEGKRQNYVKFFSDGIEVDLEDVMLQDYIDIKNAIEPDGRHCSYIARWTKPYMNTRSGMNRKSSSK
jgi:hypothetical protein